MRADRLTLIRRAYFDLIGLPPAPDEIAAFESDPAPNAFEKVVDHLLASPHYGERWGRHWLDVARYGEDQAHSFQPRLYPQGYRYRDWLVKALNDDMPYNEFVMEQIAGDLLQGPDPANRPAALGFFALGPVYYGDGKMFDQFDDRIDTLTRGFMGLTVACARCHDHKFDPIPSKDYYALAGIIASSEYTEAPLVPPEVVKAYNESQAVILAKTNEITSLLDKESSKCSAALLEQTASYLMAAWKLENLRKSEARFSVDKVAKSEGLQSFVLDRWVKFLAKPKKERRSELSKWYELLASQDAKTNLSTNDVAATETRKVAEGYQAYLLSLAKLKSAWEESQKAAQVIGAEKEKQSAAEKMRLEFLDAFIAKDGVYTLTKSEVEKLLPEDRKIQLASLRKDWTS